MRYLPYFSDHNIALLSDWLSEHRELFIHFEYPHSGGSGYFTYVRSMGELKALIAEQAHTEIFIIIFRERQFALRGVANADLLAQAKQQIPNGRYYFIFRLSDMEWITSGDTHGEMFGDFEEHAGIEVAIGEHPLDYHSDDYYIERPEIAFTLRVPHLAGGSKKNQEYYEPFALNPEKYEAVMQLWHSGKDH